MADIALTAAQIAPVFPKEAEIYAFEAAVTITAGQAVYVNTSGKIDLADANGSGTLQFRGIALNGGGAGQTIDVLKRGHVYGFTISAVAYDAPLFLSDTAGSIADGAGGTSINVGRVVPLNNTGTLTKVVYVAAEWLRTWS
jgi:hypothetical protein